MIADGVPGAAPAGLPRLLATAAGNPLALGGAVLVLVGPSGTDDAARVGFGRVVMRVWLTLHAAGVATHPLSQLVDAPASRDALGSLLGVPSARLPHVARVGRFDPERGGRKLTLGLPGSRRRWEFSCCAGGSRRSPRSLR
ncbi:hypothetical protein V6U90_28175 [Micromonospora sp. CPCC 206060]|uniref:hypothetical protein n=1 Tax=Micromonospora sp. CPCC 206060 TaxID=3122406 RepID=UPI002FEEFA26